MYLKQIDEKDQDKEFRVYMGFMDLDMTYEEVNGEALYQVVRMHDVVGKLLSVIKSM